MAQVSINFNKESYSLSNPASVLTLKNDLTSIEAALSSLTEENFSDSASLPSDILDLTGITAMNLNNNVPLYFRNALGALDFNLKENASNVLVISGADEILIDQNNNKTALHIDAEATTAITAGLLVETVATSGRGFAYVGVGAHTGNSDTGDEFLVYNSNANSNGVLFSVVQVGGTQTAAKIRQDGSGSALFIDNNGAGQCVNIDADCNSASALYAFVVNLNNSGAGPEFLFNLSGSEIDASAVGGTQNKKIRIEVGATTYYIPLYTA